MDNIIKEIDIRFGNYWCKDIRLSVSFDIDFLIIDGFFNRDLRHELKFKLYDRD